MFSKIFKPILIISLTIITACNPAEIAGKLGSCNVETPQGNFCIGFEYYATYNFDPNYSLVDMAKAKCKTEFISAGTKTTFNANSQCASEGVFARCVDFYEEKIRDIRTYEEATIHTEAYFISPMSDSDAEKICNDLRLSKGKYQNLNE